MHKVVHFDIYSSGVVELFVHIDVVVVVVVVHKIVVVVMVL